MKQLLFTIFGLLAALTSGAANKYDNPDTLFVSRDGTCEFRNIGDAIEVCRAFMDYSKVIFVKKGVYKEKLVIPSWLTHITICGEDAGETVITYDDHANIKLPGGKPMGTFRTYTLLVQGSYITLKNLTVENNAAKLGQAVSLHIEGDHVLIDHCRLLGNQDTVYTGIAGSRAYFNECYIEGTTDFIFGPGLAWFEKCRIHSKANSYITAASSPAGQKYGYVFNNCKLTADSGIDKVYLGRPWRPFAATLFMNCEMGSHIRPEGWHNWNKASNEQTARYGEYNNCGEGAGTKQRVAWSRQLSKKEAQKITVLEVFGEDCW